MADPNSPPNGRAVGGGTGPDPRRPSQWWKAPLPGTPFRHPHSEQRRPARAHAVGPVLGPHARTDRTRDTRVAGPWLPAPEDGRPGEGQRLTPGAPHNGGRPPPRGRPPTSPAACSPSRTCRPRGQCWAPTPTHPRPQRVGGGPLQPAQWAGSRGRDGAWPQTPPTMVEGTPPGDALPPPPQRATPARKGARCGASAGSPRPHRPHPGHTGRGTLVARSRGRAAGGGTAPDTRRPPQRWQATPPPGTAPHHPRGTQPPQGMQAKGTVLGPHTHTPAPTARGWRTPGCPPSGRAVGGGTAPDLRRPPQRWTAPPPGTPSRHPHSEQRRPARVHAAGPVLGPHARTDRTRDTRVAEPWLPTSEGGRPGEGQRLTPGAPLSGGRPPPPGTAPRHPRGMQPPQGMQAKGTVLGCHTHTPAPTARGWRTPTARPIGGQSGEGQGLTSDAPHTMVEGAPPGDTLPPPPQRATPARKGARCGAGEGPHARADRTRDTRVAEPRLPAPEDGQSGEGQRLTPDAPRNDGKHPPGDAHPPPLQRATHQRTNAPVTGHPHPTPCS